VGELAKWQGVQILIFLNVPIYLPTLGAARDNMDINILVVSVKY